MERLKIFGKDIIDNESIEQIKNCIGEEDLGVLTADAHYGYRHPIGGVVAYKNHISVSGVGFDIACGNKAVRTNIKALDINIAKVMDEIYHRISFGVGRHTDEPVDHPVIEQIEKADFEPQRNLLDLAIAQLGTVGAGNHFVDLFEDDAGYIWIGVHFGSRGFGFKTTSGFISLSQGKSFYGKGQEGSMSAKPILFNLTSELGQAYISAMRLAGKYAYAGRDIVVDRVLEILGTKETTFEVHNHHNFIWEEEHFGQKYWVVRKGCTPAFPSQFGFVGANMEDTSVIIKGKDTEQSKQGLYSTVHGAGRVMSRTKAAGKKKWKRGRNGVTRPTYVSTGAVDFNAVKQRLKNKVELRGSGADEAPECYKKLDEVLDYQEDTIEVLYRLHPIGVAMAGDETFDPYKD